MKKYLRNPDDVEDEWARTTINTLSRIDPLHASATAALHDEGREITHLFYTTDLIGRRLLKRIGIREDILDILPSEDIMLTHPDESMDETIKKLPPEAVIIRIADDFRKRAPGTNRLYQPEDYDNWDRDAWAQNYLTRPFSGRPSDAAMRANMQLHIDNAPRYPKALDNWLTVVTTLSLDDLTKHLDVKLSPTLSPV